MLNSFHKIQRDNSTYRKHPMKNRKTDDLQGQGSVIFFQETLVPCSFLKDTKSVKNKRNRGA